MKYEPYNFDSFKELVTYAYRLGWYDYTNIFTLKCDGGFERFSGRASETWEQRFTLSSEDVVFSKDKKIPAFSFTGETIKEVCDKVMEYLKSINAL